MKKIILAIFLATASSILSAQVANVIQLSDADAQQAQSLKRQQDILDAKWAALRLRITHNYLEASISQKGGCAVDHILVDFEWGCGEFTFSSNFKFIVPSQNVTKSPSYDKDTVFFLDDGVPTVIKEKSEWEIDEETGLSHWVFNNETTKKP